MFINASSPLSSLPLLVEYVCKVPEDSEWVNSLPKIRTIRCGAMCLLGACVITARFVVRRGLPVLHLRKAPMGAGKRTPKRKRKQSSEKPGLPPCPRGPLFSLGHFDPFVGGEVVSGDIESIAKSPSSPSRLPPSERDPPKARGTNTGRPPMTPGNSGSLKKTKTRKTKCGPKAASSNCRAGTNPRVRRRRKAPRN